MLSCRSCSVSEAGQSASFCHACYFLCDWQCERWRKREAMIRQRSHVAARQPDNKFLCPLFCDPVSSASCNICRGFNKWRKMIGLFNLRSLPGPCATVLCTYTVRRGLLQPTLTWRNAYSLSSERCGQTYITDCKLALLSFLSSFFLHCSFPLSFSRWHSPTRCDYYNNIHRALLEC